MNDDRQTVSVFSGVDVVIPGIGTLLLAVTLLPHDEQKKDRTGEPRARRRPA
jgi:hypothetical protein